MVFRPVFQEIKKFTIVLACQVFRSNSICDFIIYIQVKRFIYLFIYFRYEKDDTNRQGRNVGNEGIIEDKGKGEYCYITRCSITYHVYYVSINSFIYYVSKITFWLNMFTITCCLCSLFWTELFLAYHRIFESFLKEPGK